MRNVKFIIPMLIFALVNVNCKEKDKANDIHGTITFIRGDVQINKQKVAIGSQVNANDEIVVGGKSTAVIQFANSAMVTVEANTSLSVEKLLIGDNGKPNIELTQNRGSTFNKIMPGEAEYNIHTPTITAGVRGTSFSVNMKNNKTSEIKLFRGKVAVKKAPAANAPATDAAATTPKEEVLILEAGSKIEVNEGDKISEVKAEKLEVKEVETLAKLNEIAFVSDNSLGKIETAPPEESEEVLADMETVVPAEIEAIIIEVEEENQASRVVTLDDLKKQYGTLSEVRTKSGKTYIGAFKQVGGNIEIITTEGKKTINASQISKVKQY